MTAITCTSASKAMTAVAEIRRRLAKATDLGKIKDLHDRAVELLSRKGTSALDRDVSYQAAELKLVAERKMGLILAALHLRGGDRRSAVAARKLTLDRLRISRRQSAAWQLEGLLPDEDFAAYIQQAARDGKQPSSHGLCCLARRYVESTAFAGNSPECFGRVAGGLRTLARQGRQFACILIDSPGAAASKGRASAFRIDPRLAHLPLLEVAAPQAHIYLRATPESREEGAKLLRAWGLAWKATLACTEAALDPHALWQPVRELWLLGVRDVPGRDDPGLPPWIEGAGVLPTATAQALYEFVERVSQPPYLDLFGSRPFSKDWTIAATRERGSK